MRKKVATILPIVLVLCGCEPAKDNQFDFEKLVGRWEYLDPRSHQVEEWARVNNQLYEGKGFVLEKGDTTFIEFLRIEKQDSSWVYVAQVSSENNNEEVPFRLAYQTDERAEFTNLMHDFPQRIVYVFKNDNELQAYIEGPQQGKTARITFDFTRKLAE
jgi:hypothetical protein